MIWYEKHNSLVVILCPWCPLIRVSFIKFIKGWIKVCLTKNSGSQHSLTSKEQRPFFRKQLLWVVVPLQPWSRELHWIIIWVYFHIHGHFWAPSLSPRGPRGPSQRQPSSLEYIGDKGKMKLLPLGDKFTGLGHALSSGVLMEFLVCSGFGSWVWHQHVSSNCSVITYSIYTGGKQPLFHEF